MVKNSAMNEIPLVEISIGGDRSEQEVTVEVDGTDAVIEIGK
jgi:hypothetical protein